MANLIDGTVSVISGQSNTITAIIPVSPFPHAIAVNPETNLVYVTNVADSTLSVLTP